MNQLYMFKADQTLDDAIEFDPFEDRVEDIDPLALETKELNRATGMDDEKEKLLGTFNMEQGSDEE